MCPNQDYETKNPSRLSLWQYLDDTRNYPGWNIGANTSGCKLFETCILECKKNGNATVVTLPPTADMLGRVNNLAGRAAYLCVSEVALLLARRKVKQWHVARLAGSLTIEASSDGLNEFLVAIRQVAKGEDDFAIGPRRFRAAHPVFWFWNGRSPGSLDR